MELGLVKGKIKEKEGEEKKEGEKKVEPGENGMMDFTHPDSAAQCWKG